MPPVHPALVHYPIALMTLSVVADLFGRLYESPSLRAAGWWGLAGAAAGAALALVAGLFDMSREKIGREAHRRVHTHMKVGFVLFTLIAGLTVWRWLIYTDSTYGLGWGYLATAAAVLGLTFFQGWLGGELVFADGVGVAPTGQGTEPAAEAKGRAEKASGGGEKHQGH